MKSIRIIWAAMFFALGSWAQAQSFTVLHTFVGLPDGANPFAGLIRDSAGNLYGTAESGGANGLGTILKLDANGQVTLLYSFTGGKDGSNPTAGLVRDGSGNLYGTTMQSGVAGWGTVFKLSSAGQLSVLYAFTGGKDGGIPRAALIRDSAGNLYGTASEGGNLACNGGAGCGVVFMVNSANQETVLHSFKGGSDGAFPVASLVRDTAGNLYGTAPTGGDVKCNGPSGCGIVFKLTPAGVETVLHRFHGIGGDGSFPEAGLVRDGAGNLYGTTSTGGVYSQGTVVKISPTGSEKVLYSFNGSDGATPMANLVRDAAGNLYGTTTYGGASGSPGYGTVFELDAAGHQSVLHSFQYASDGSFPFAPLLRDSAGNLYGTTSNNGPSTCNQVGCGTVFKLP